MTTNTAPCILIEGMDLAGKTSACRALVAGMSLPPDHRRNAMTSDNVVFEIADQLRRERGLSGVYLGHLYLAATAMDLRRYVPPKRLTIQEFHHRAAVAGALPGSWRVRPRSGLRRPAGSRCASCFRLQHFTDSKYRGAAGSPRDTPQGGTGGDCRRRPGGPHLARPLPTHGRHPYRRDDEALRIPVMVNSQSV